MDDILGVLEHERRATLERLTTMTANFDQIVAASQGSNADEEHDPEGATIAFERSQLDAVMKQARAHLADIDAAISRVADGSYGMCDVCGNPIPHGRLIARPTAHTCVACAERSR